MSRKRRRKSQQKDNLPFKTSEIRRLAKEGKIEFVSKEQVGYLDDYIQQVLDVIADVTDVDGIRHAWVSDLSGIGDFFQAGMTAEERVENQDEEDPNWWHQEYTDFVNAIAEQLGVELEVGFEEPEEDGTRYAEMIYVVDVAKKLAHGD